MISNKLFAKYVKQLGFYTLKKFCDISKKFAKCVK